MGVSNWAWVRAGDVAHLSNARVEGYACNNAATRSILQVGSGKCRRVGQILHVDNRVIPTHHLRRKTADRRYKLQIGVAQSAVVVLCRPSLLRSHTHTTVRVLIWVSDNIHKNQQIKQ